ncbi:VOC family protein [Oceanobacillus sp. 1P07AA]|uniref:VOC family protein n=1 Tax=Oceanobacillus sp. 1P07AA TaxID=3132293 RepID=UPI0039A6BE36
MGFRIKQIDHIQLSAPKGSEDKARNFYIDILGFDEEIKPEELQKNGGVWFKTGGVSLHIGIEEPFQSLKKAHPAIEVENIPFFQKYLEEKGISTQPDDKLPGAIRFYVRDPFGNRLEFLEWIQK